MTNYYSPKEFAQLFLLWAKHNKIQSSNRVMGNQEIHIFNDGGIVCICPLPAKKTLIKFINSQSIYQLKIENEINTFDELIQILKIVGG